MSNLLFFCLLIPIVAKSLNKCLRKESGRESVSKKRNNFHNSSNDIYTGTFLPAFGA
jgi:UPF0716 family protein affecting phage T7 exclusion